MTSTPIRIGLVGLSASQPAAWANNAHFPFLSQESTSYEIVALANSSATSAEAAIKQFNLASTTKAYGSPEEIAADPNIDLAVASVQTASHYKVIKPALLVGKSAYVEWPLGASLSQAEELAALAKAGKGRTFVGLQARHGPAIRTIKQLVAEGRIGNVISTTVNIELGTLPFKVPERFRSVNDPSLGGTFFTIVSGHVLDPFIQVLGHFESLNALIANQYPTLDFISETTGAVVESGVAKPTPDHISVQGKLESGAIASVTIRTGEIVPDTPTITWKIFGAKGHIIFTGSILSFQMGDPGQVVKIFDAKSAKWEIVETIDNKEELPIPARNIARTYEAFAAGVKGTYATFDDAVVLHRLLDAMERSSQSGERVSYVHN